MGAAENPTDAMLAHRRRADALLGQVGSIDQAIAEYQQALAFAPDDVHCLENLGVALYLAGRMQPAVQCFEKLVALGQANAGTFSNFGSALLQLGRLEPARLALEKAIHLDPGSAGSHENLGHLFIATGQFEEAVVAYNHAIQLNPADATAYNSLGVAYLEMRRYEPAMKAFEKSLALNPPLAMTYVNLGRALLEQGFQDRAIEAYRQASGLDPASAATGSALLLALHYSPAFDAASIRREHRHWANRFADPLTAVANIQHENDRSPDRRLRIGYCSPDFRTHPVGRFLQTILDHHNRDGFEVRCYSDVRTPDEVTEALCSSAGHWFEATGLSDEELAGNIRDDRIDILVDLALHSARNRLLTFARKPAPIQLTYLAYAGTSGMTAMDYRLTDGYIDRIGNDAFYSEQSLRLKSYWCYRPPSDAPAPVAATPGTREGFITFGCLNSFSKVTPAALSLWARLLAANENSRLLLYCPAEKRHAQIRELFSEHGVAETRLSFVGFRSPADYFQIYNSIDIALDPFPYNGGITTCDALWMGVPVVTLAGGSGVSRAGVSILSNISLPELIAQSQADCIRIASDLARDSNLLSELRQTLRQKMQASPLMNAEGFTQNLEALYRQIWRKWCANTAAV